ncbi:MAG: hypothetical protein WDZ72_11875 [Cyclobacteriaceae bacterium]
MKTTIATFNSDYTEVGKIIFKNLFKLLIAGLFIGVFYANDGLVAAFLGLYLILSISKRWKKKLPDRKIYLAGAVISGFLGFCCELWGIANEFWQYHDLEGHRQIPYWLPFAWALAFTYVYKLEKEIFEAMNRPPLSTKMVIALGVAMVFPTFGEIITINLGVWTYSWPYQVLGVPVLAIFLLMVFHTGVNLIMSWICKYQGWKNIVFNHK